MTPALTYDDVWNMYWPEDEFPRLVRKLGGKERWKSCPVSFLEMKLAGVDPYAIVRIAGLYKGDARYQCARLLWKADCAARSLHIFQKTYPSESGPAEAIKAARAFARGAIGESTFRAAQTAAHATARRLSWNTAAWFAAMVATCSEPLVYAVIATGKTVAGVIQYQDNAVMAREAHWQVERLIARMSDNEPEDWPLDWPGEVA